MAHDSEIMTLETRVEGLKQLEQKARAQFANFVEHVFTLAKAHQDDGGVITWSALYNVIKHAKTNLDWVAPEPQETAPPRFMVNGKELDLSDIVTWTALHNRTHAKMIEAPNRGHHSVGYGPLLDIFEIPDRESIPVVPPADWRDGERELRAVLGWKPGETTMEAARRVAKVASEPGYDATLERIRMKVGAADAESTEGAVERLVRELASLKQTHSGCIYKDLIELVHEVVMPIGQESVVDAVKRVAKAAHGGFSSNTIVESQNELRSVLGWQPGETIVGAAKRVAAEATAAKTPTVAFYEGVINLIREALEATNTETTDNAAKRVARELNVAKKQIEKLVEENVELKIKIDNYDKTEDSDFLYKDLLSTVRQILEASESESSHDAARRVVAKAKTNEQDASLWRKMKVQLSTFGVTVEVKEAPQ